MSKILISSCLLGQSVRYDGRHLKSDDAVLCRWLDNGIVVALCPEVAAGMPIPRPPAEIQAGGGAAVLKGLATVRDIRGADVTEPFIRGAQTALALCVKHQITMAVLADGSPSCGSRNIYNGEFSSQRIEGCGVTTALLRKNGIQVFSQHQFEDADRHFSRSPF